MKKIERLFQPINTLRASMAAISLLLLFSSCRKFIEGMPYPETAVTQNLVFAEDATAIAAISGIYSGMIESGAWSAGGAVSLTVRCAVYGDELSYFTSPNSTSTLAPYFFNSLVTTDQQVSITWTSCYNLIYSSNRLIEGLDKSTTISPSVRKQLIGEALFIRAFCHFYLLNLFGDVPYITSTDYLANKKVNRTASALVYQHIISDLVKAKQELSTTYPSADRVRVNKGAATALLARTYLYSKDWINAATQASELIDNPSQYELIDSLDEVFLKGSKEAIWQILPGGGSSLHTAEAEYFILYNTPTNKTAITPQLFNAFETGDKRKTNWIGTIKVGQSTWYYPFKYKESFSNETGKEYSMVMRLGEQYLIRAEARTQLGNLTGTSSAASDIDHIRHRAGLPLTIATTKAGLLAAVEQERKAELFTEWGHRFFDLKRWGRLDEVLTPVKPNWNSTDSLWPIPQSERLANKNLTQNDGY